MADITVTADTSSTSMNKPVILLDGDPLASVAVYKQSWKCSVRYQTHDDGTVVMPDFILLCRKMDTVYRYLQRRFLRVAKVIESIDVKDAGYTSKVDCLELLEWSDGAITARKASDGTVMAEERSPRPNTLAEACEAILCSLDYTKPLASGPGYTTAPSVPRVEFPPLDSYAVFAKVPHPGLLHERGSKFFKSKFYDVFPREK
jgi:hypothetical protein